MLNYIKVTMVTANTNDWFSYSFRRMRMRHAGPTDPLTWRVLFFQCEHNFICSVHTEPCMQCDLDLDKI